MAKRQSQIGLPDGGRGPAQKAILFEVTGNERNNKRPGDELPMQRIAALSREEVFGMLEARAGIEPISASKTKGLFDSKRDRVQEMQRITGL
jgi:hypothetical protein